MSPLYTTRQDLIPAAVGGRMATSTRRVACLEGGSRAPEPEARRSTWAGAPHPCLPPGSHGFGAPANGQVPLLRFQTVLMSLGPSTWCRIAPSSRPSRRARSYCIYSRTPTADCSRVSVHAMRPSRFWARSRLMVPVALVPRGFGLARASWCQWPLSLTVLGSLAPHGASDPRPSRFWAASASWCQWPSSLAVLGC